MIYPNIKCIIGKTSTIYMREVVKGFIKVLVEGVDAKTRQHDLSCSDRNWTEKGHHFWGRLAELRGWPPGWISWSFTFDNELLTDEVVMVKGEGGTSSVPKPNGRHFLWTLAEHRRWPQAGTAGLPNLMMNWWLIIIMMSLSLIW